MIKAVIMAGGVPKTISRHLKIPFFRFRRVIDYSLIAATRAKLEIALVCSAQNTDLINYIAKNYPHVQILNPIDDLMISSFKTAFSHDNFKTDKIIIAGDLISLNHHSIAILSEYLDTDVLSTLNKPFKKQPYLKGLNPNFKFRTDVGQGVFVISRSSQLKVITNEFFDTAKEIRRQFYGDKAFDESTANDVWTWLLFLLFNEIYEHSENKYTSSPQKLVNLKIKSADDYDI